MQIGRCSVVSFQYGYCNHNLVYVVTLRQGELKWEYVPKVVTRPTSVDSEIFEVNSKNEPVGEAAGA